MMAKQRGNKPSTRGPVVIGTHHGLMHGPQSHPQQFYRRSAGGTFKNITIIF